MVGILFGTYWGGENFQGWNASFREGNNARQCRKNPSKLTHTFLHQVWSSPDGSHWMTPVGFHTLTGRIWLWLSGFGKISFLSVFAKFCSSTNFICQYNSGSNYQLSNWKILMFYSKRKYIKTNQPYNSTWVRDCLHFKKPCSNMCYLLFVHISTPRMLRHSSRYLLSIWLCQRMKHWDLDELRKAETELQEMRILKQKIVNKVLNHL